MDKKKHGEKCVLYDRDCIGCGECEFCDLDPLKICDNCGACLKTDDYATFKIDGIYEDYPSHGDHCDCGCDDCSSEHNHEHKTQHKANNKNIH